MSHHVNENHRLDVISSHYTIQMFSFRFVNFRDFWTKLKCIINALFQGLQLFSDLNYICEIPPWFGVKHNRMTSRNISKLKDGQVLVASYQRCRNNQLFVGQGNTTDCGIFVSISN